jgi:hypothetical protein
MPFAALYNQSNEVNLIDVYPTRERARDQLVKMIDSVWNDFFAAEDKLTDPDELIGYFGVNNPAGIEVGVVEVHYSKPTTYAELMSAMYDIAPDCTADEDCDGQIVIHTDLQEGPDGQLKEFNP